MGHTPCGSRFPHYARASGRSFAAFLDELFWAKKEAIGLLKNRSGYHSIHTEDLSDVTDRMRVVYERSTA
jgi:DNA-binding IclR family transcriptional regulator